MAKYISKQAAIFALTNEANTHSNPVKRAYTRAAAIIEQITAEDVQPVRHGKWEYYKNNGIKYVFKCTNCDKRIELTMDELNRNDMPDGWEFCPKCGADMRGDPDV